MLHRADSPSLLQRDDRPVNRLSVGSTRGSRHTARSRPGPAARSCRVSRFSRIPTLPVLAAVMTPIHSDPALLTGVRVRTDTGASVCNCRVCFVYSEFILAARNTIPIARSFRSSPLLECCISTRPHRPFRMPVDVVGANTHTIRNINCNPIRPFIHSRRFGYVLFARVITSKPRPTDPD